MTNAEFRDAVVVSYRESGLEPPQIRVTGDEQTGFTVAFTTTVWTRDPAGAVAEFRAAAAVQSLLVKPDIPPIVPPETE